MATLDDLVRELLDTYAERDPDGTPVPGTDGPGLLRRLDTLSLRTAQPRQAGMRSAPGPRPPASDSALRWSLQIKAEAVTLDMQLRNSPYAQPWTRALRAIPPNAEAAARVRDATSSVGRWHSTARTVLGLQPPAIAMRGVACLVCGQRTIKCRTDDDRPRAWCTNTACTDGDTGKPARYDNARLYLLTTNIAS